MMKKSILSILTLGFLLVACTGWKQEDKTKFVQNCLIQFADSDIPDTSLADYCTCMQERIEMQFEADTWQDSISEEEWIDVDTNCLKAAGLNPQGEALPEVTFQ